MKHLFEHDFDKKDLGMSSRACVQPTATPAGLSAGEPTDWDLADWDLAAADVPPTDEELWQLVSGPGCDLPHDTAAWLPDVPADLPPGHSAAPESAGVREALPAGRLPRDGGDGTGFAAGRVADHLPPGTVLAGFASDVWADGLDRITDHELIGVLLAWRRLNSWTAAGELAAVAELNRRRLAEVAAGADPHLAEHVGDELALPLTLTTRGADQLLDFACRLDRLPRTRMALAAGEIDRLRTLVIADELSGLDDAHAAAVEAEVIGRAPGQTTGQLRAAVRRAVLAADPAAARRQREQAEKEARVEIWSEHSGTAALSGRDLPPADVLAADERIDALARQLKTAGAPGSLDQLRARAYTALLLGRPMPAALSGPGGGHAEQDGQNGQHGRDPYGAAGPSGRPTADDQPAPRAGLINLTMPLATWLGASQAPAEVAGFGPIAAEDGRALAARLGGGPGPRWCLTLTGADGAAVAHGCGRVRWQAGRAGGASAGSWALTVTIRPLAAGSCGHERESGSYRPPPTLRHLITIRQRTCSFPGCRRPATGCDQDHSIPYHLGGRTCECNLAPLCRRHHRAKQVQGWHLAQPEPGVLVWTLPHGRSYHAGPDPYPAAGAEVPDSVGNGEPTGSSESSGNQVSLGHQQNPGACDQLGPAINPGSTINPGSAINLGPRST
jgi:hypothetical protein